MSPAIWLLVYALAVYRLAELVSTDLIFETIRRGIGKRAAAGRLGWNAIADWIYCPLCVGVWFSLPAAFLFNFVILQLTNFIHILPLWLGIAGFQYLLSSRNLDEDDN